MWIQQVAEKIAQALPYLPLEKLKEARDYVLSLKERFGFDQPVDESDDWTEEDLRDVTQASLKRWDEMEGTEGDKDAELV